MVPMTLTSVKDLPNPLGRQPQTAAHSSLPKSGLHYKPALHALSTPPQTGPRDPIGNELYRVKILIKQSLASINPARRRRSTQLASPEDLMLGLCVRRVPQSSLLSLTANEVSRGTRCRTALRLAKPRAGGGCPLSRNHSGRKGGTSRWEPARRRVRWAALPTFCFLGAGWRRWRWSPGPVWGGVDRAWMAGL
jgi:hypothetical protein